MFSSSYGDIVLLKRLGMKPSIISSRGEATLRISINNREYIYGSNWSGDLKDSVYPHMGNSRRYLKTSIRSGSGTFYMNRGILLDLQTKDILFLRVTTDGDNIVNLVSDMFDTPRCPHKYKNIRIHWRKYTQQAIETGTKVVKISHQELQKFKLRYTYVPTDFERSQLEVNIINNVSKKSDSEKDRFFESRLKQIRR